MWRIKTFKTKEAMENFIRHNNNKMQWEEVFVNNEYAIQYKRLIKIL